MWPLLKNGRLCERKKITDQCKDCSTRLRLALLPNVKLQKMYYLFFSSLSGRWWRDNSSRRYVGCFDDRRYRMGNDRRTTVALQRIFRQRQCTDQWKKQFIETAPQPQGRLFSVWNRTFFVLHIMQTNPDVWRHGLANKFICTLELFRPSGSGPEKKFNAVLAGGASSRI